MIIKIIFYITLIILLINFIIKRFINTMIIKTTLLDTTGCAVVGQKGYGKDCLFSFTTYKKPHNCNIELHKYTNIIALKELMIPNLDRHHLMEGKNLNIDFSKYKKFENPTFISDSGIYFPNYDDQQLKKEYPNLAISIALWRHLYDAPINFNLQDFNRLWKIIREQIEHVIIMNNCTWKFGYCILKLTYYENKRDAELGLKPIKKKLFGKKEYINVEESKRDFIKQYKLYIPKRMINHNTRAFRELIFSEESLKKEAEQDEKRIRHKKTTENTN